MAVTEGVDYSTGRPSPICLYQGGRRFVGRYFGAGSSGKHATAKEVAALHAAGLSVFSIVEGAQHDPLAGRKMGRTHADVGSRAAQAAGMPDDRPLYFAVDFDVQPIQFPAVAEYLRGCADVIGVHRVGVYGGLKVVDWAWQEGLAAWRWQTYAWSGGKWSAHAHIQQYRNHRTVCGATVDLCRTSKVDYGQWPAPRQTIGENPTPPEDSTVDTGWDFTGHVDALAGVMGGLADTMDSYARATQALGT